MTIQIGDVLEVSARMEFDSVDDIVNVYQFVLGTPGPITDAQGVSDVIQIMEDLYTLWLSAMSLLVAFRDLRVRNVTQQTVLGTFPWPTLTVGTNVNDALPPGVAALINFTSDIARVTPRKYFGGITEVSNDSEGTWVAGLVTTMTNTAAFLLAVRVQAFGDWLYGYESPKAASFVFPTGGVVTDVPAYQRRRKQGRGS